MVIQLDSDRPETSTTDAGGASTAPQARRLAPGDPDRRPREEPQVDKTPRRDSAPPDTPKQTQADPPVEHGVGDTPRPADSGGTPASADSGATPHGSATGPPADDASGSGLPGDARTSATDVQSLLDAAPKSKDVTDLQGLFLYAYARKGQRLTLPNSVAERLRDTADLDEAATPIIQALASGTDPCLAVPGQILALIARNQVSGPLRRRMLSGVHLAIRSNAVLAALDLANIMAWDRVQDAAEATDPDEVLRQVADAVNAIAPEALGQDVTKGDLLTLRTNAVTSVALLLTLRFSYGMPRLVRLLNRHLWQVLERESTEPLMLEITLGHGPAAMAAVSDTWLAEVSTAAEQVAQEAERASGIEEARQELLVRLGSSEARIELLEGEARQQAALVQQLRQQIEAEQQTRQDQRAHASSDYETLRARVIRMLKAQKELLEEGLTAARREPPKVHITTHRIEESLKHLERELRVLREET